MLLLGHILTSCVKAIETPGSSKAYKLVPEEATKGNILQWSYKTYFDVWEHGMGQF
jgi:hypothetical protein